MDSSPITESSLKEAIHRFDDFRSVHHGKGDYPEAMAILNESLGATDDMIAELDEWAEENFLFDYSEGIGGPVLLGFTIGLMAANYAK